MATTSNTSPESSSERVSPFAMSSSNPNTSSQSTSSSSVAAPSSGIASTKRDSASTKDELLFTLFPKLPLELRRNIWKQACFVPRNIDIWVQDLLEGNSLCGRSYNSRFRGHFRYPLNVFSYRSLSRPPAVLHATGESRAIGLEHYSLEFGTDIEQDFDRSTIRASTPAQVYVN